MILTCPECSARYIVDPTALLPDGRMVRCAKCKHSWKEPAPEIDMPVVDAAEATGPETPKEASETTTTEDTSENLKEDNDEEFAIKRNRRKKRPRPLPKGSNLPALQNHKHGDILWGWYGLGAFIAIFITGFLVFQTTISNVWPPSQKLYLALGLEDHSGSPNHDNTASDSEKAPQIPYHEQFKIIDTVPSKIRDGKRVTLKVQGNITNLTDKTLPLPLLKISLKDSRGQVIREWTFKSSAATIAENEKVPYVTSLSNPPEDATSIGVTFADQ